MGYPHKQAVYSTAKQRNSKIDHHLFQKEREPGVMDFDGEGSGIVHISSKNSKC